MKKSIMALMAISLLFISGSCDGSKKMKSTISSIPVIQSKSETMRTPGPEAVIYKTVKDYSDLVPVIMNNERTQIISYPAPSDVYYKGKLAKPTPLKEGYWLDNRGINENVAFTAYTYEEYSALTETPAMNLLLSKIIDKYPLIELIACGPRSKYSNEIKDLNELIDNHFEGCKIIEIKPPLPAIF
jgi:hypothetical protein